MPQTPLSIGLRSTLLVGHMSGLMNWGVSAQKLIDCVTSTMCWRIVLLEDKHVSSNAADRWQQLLHQQHVSVLQPVKFCFRLNEYEVGTAEIGYCKSACIEYQSATRTSCGTDLLRQELNISTAWWNATLPSVKRKSFALYKVVW